MKRNIFTLFILVLVLTLVPVTFLHAEESSEPSVTYEAENGVLEGTVISTSTPGFSGSGFVTGFDNADDTVALTVNADVSSLYSLTIGYRSPYGMKYTNLSLNGSSSGEVALPETKEFTEVSGGKLLLKAGVNTVSFKSGWGWYDIDYIKLQKATIDTSHEVTKTLVNPNASPEAKTLIGYLVDQYGKSILSGQQEISNINWIYETTGKKPAVAGFDFMDYSPSRTERGATSSEVENAVKWHNQGGIVTFVWHWNAPKGLYDVPGKEWWRGFYTNATSFDVDYAVNHPESEDYQLLVRDIDAIAAQIKKLEDAHAPVLFRPLHEAEGGWFWWGAKGPEPAKKLYRMVYDRLTNHHHINNLIWIWNSIDPAWYPGDDIVDIVSADNYPPAGDYSPVMNKYDSLKDLVHDKKMVALTENGAIPDPGLLTAYGAHWSWFCTWSDYFLKDGVHNSREHLIQVYNHPYVITLDELPDLFRTVHIHNLDVKLDFVKGKTWATATVVVVDDKGNPVSDAIVSGQWSGKAGDVESGVTGADGTVRFESDKSNPGPGAFTFTVTSLSHQSYSYEAGDNEKTEGSVSRK